MSTSPETLYAGDEIVSLLSEWLAVHVSNDELRERLSAIGTDGLGDEEAELVGEVLLELEQAGEAKRGDLEMLVRETLAAVALG